MEGIGMERKGSPLLNELSIPEAEALLGRFRLYLIG